MPGRSFRGAEFEVTFAQTNVQLFNQLRLEGYAKQEIFLVWKAYEFGMRLFSGLFLPSGKPFIDHLVGTASILTWLHMPVEIVAAGLIHAAYLHGDFGTLRMGISEKKRKEIRKMVDEKVEEYVAKYDRLMWNPPRILIIRDTLDELDPVERNVLLIRLSNELEHHLDLGALYFAGDASRQAGHQRYIQRYGPIMTEMAERLGTRLLATEMQIVFNKTIAAKPPIEPCIRSNHSMAYLVSSRSYRDRFSTSSLRKLVHGYQLASKALVRLTTHR
jgi:(p)ppGpp synthase/HD superfamily hydrolase